MYTGCSITTILRCIQGVIPYSNVYRVFHTCIPYLHILQLFSEDETWGSKHVNVEDIVKNLNMCILVVYIMKLYYNARCKNIKLANDASYQQDLSIYQTI